MKSKDNPNHITVSATPCKDGRYLIHRQNPELGRQFLVLREDGGKEWTTHEGNAAYFSSAVVAAEVIREIPMRRVVG